MKRICVFCGSSAGNKPDYETAAREMGTSIARRGLGLVYGGGRVGLMGIVANAAVAAGGEVIGVIPTTLATKELSHTGLTELRVVDSMHERKALMAELADAFIALPGGYGTLEEFCEIVTWAQLGLHRKPCALLNTCGYFDPLKSLFDHAVMEGFVAPDHRALVLERDSTDELLRALEEYKAPYIQKWIDREKT